MPLIDQDLKTQNSDLKDEIKCKNCNKNLDKNSPILLCENCFNENVKNTLNVINTNISKIKSDLINVENSIKQLNEDLKRKNLHIIVINKIEIDLLNFHAIKEKLIVDLNLNKKAFIINQEQANKLRSLLKWGLFDIIRIEE